MENDMAHEKDTLVGRIDFLKVDRLEGSTYHLLGPNSEPIKMNASEVEDDDQLEIGEDYSFFVYPSRSGELFATQNMPTITKDRYDWVKVLRVDRDGAAVDVGLPREVLIPWEDLPKVKDLWPQNGDMIFCTLRIDSNSQMFARLATETIVDTMYKTAEESILHQHVTARPYRLLRVGTFLLSEDGYKIFVHESERKHEPRLGEEMDVRIIGVKENGELNGSFLPLAHERLDEDGQVIFDLLVEYDGELPFWDKSNPEAIKEVFNMSKASFKRAIGRLYKQKLITIETGKITITKKGWAQVKKED